LKDSSTNPVSSKENPREIAQYEKLFANLMKDPAKPDGCTLKKNINVDVVEVTDPLAKELLKKLNVDKEKSFKKRTMVMIMTEGSGSKVQGPTAPTKLINELVEKKLLEGTCEDGYKDFSDENNNE
jgi:hypothetical protein